MLDALQESSWLDTRAGDRLIVVDGPATGGSGGVTDVEPRAKYHAIDNKFTDVTMGNWAWSYIYELRELGITAGCATDPPRCPSDPLNRGQLATMLKRMLTGPESSQNIDTPAEPTWPG